MQKHKSTISKAEQTRSRQNVKNKQNPLTDTVYLIQNQNEVLRMKNTEQNLKIKELKMQLQVISDSIALREVEIQNIRGNLKTNTFKEDIEIQNQKKLITEKITLLKSNEEILLRKINQARQVTIMEEQKIQLINNEKKGVEIEILSLRAQNEGTKIILRNLEDQNERLRGQNEKLISTRKVYEPKEKQISIQIQQRIRYIKNQRQNLKNLRTYETSKLIDGILSIIYMKKMKENYMKIDRFGLLRKYAQKNVIQLSLIRKKYILFIKNKALQKFRQSFRPLSEQETARRIISETHKRRIKAIIWRKWRKSTKEAEFFTIRKFEFHNLLDKIEQSFTKTNLYSAFNILKYFKNNPLRDKAVLVIQNNFRSFMNRSKTLFFSSLRSAKNSRTIDLEIEASSRQQTEMLVCSLYFSAWAKLTKISRIQNKNLKLRYFKELKKLIALKNRRRLGEMLLQTNKKINNVDLESKIFTEIKKQTIVAKIQGLQEQHQLLNEKTELLQAQVNQIYHEKKSLYQQLALLRISAYLKKKMQKAFDIWRLRKQQSKVLLCIMNMIEGKKSNDKNFAFCKILKKRFAMLKKSIRDKIQSCQFSYNYLLDENRHIKQVLDKKQHELEKTKFVNIIKRIIKQQKQYKLKYFYKFMKNGFKYWKFRKTVQRIDKMADKKIKIVFMWLLKQDIGSAKQENRIQTFVTDKQKIINTKLMKYALTGFLRTRQNNKKLKRIMGNIFSRNLELSYYQAFGKIRNEEHLQNKALIKQDIDAVKSQIEQRDNVVADETNRIQILTERLKDKQETFRERKLLTLYLFYSKSIIKKVGSYIQKWHNKVNRQNKVMEFAQILERKSRILLKSKFFLTVHKKNEDYTLNQFQERLGKFKHEYDHMSYEQDKFIKETEKQSIRMKGQNETNKKQGEYLEKKTDFMTNIKLKSFSKSWGKKLIAFVFKYWRKQTNIFIETWSKLDKKYHIKTLQQTWVHFSRQVQYDLLKDKLRKNLSRIYHASFLHNAGLGFNIWRFVNLHKKNQIWTEEQMRQMKKFEGLQTKYKYAINKHNGQVDYRLFDGLTRGTFNKWRKYAQKKASNTIKKGILNKWMWKAYSSQFLRLLKKKVNKKIAFNERLNAFKNKWKNIRLQSFMIYTASMKKMRHSFSTLFINKYCPFLVHQVHEQFFSKIKNYINNNQVNKIDDKTQRIQKVIAVFEKKRKSILNVNLRKWRRNQYQMNISKLLMRRITKNAMNWRVRDLFYAWKLQAEAKNVKIMHEEEGQVKKRKIEIKRIKIFLEDFKKQKGLLLEDEGGQLVVSPRFQQKKQLQIKKDNNLRYRFISRLILSMNNYGAPVKAYNNLKMYKILRQKYKKHALVVRNKLRKPDLYYAFKIWNKATKDFNKMFETMERKDLIKILNKQKDKMEMEYSKKINLQDSIKQEMKIHKILSYQQDRKERLCAHVFLKNLRKVKIYGLLTWKKRVNQLKEAQLTDLEDKGNVKMNDLEEEVNQLQQLERQLKQNNLKLQSAVDEALEIAEMVKRITQQRDLLSKLITQKLLTCESLQEENQELNAKLYLAQKQAMNLLIISGERL